MAGGGGKWLAGFSQNVGIATSMAAEHGIFRKVILEMDSVEALLCLEKETQKRNPNHNREIKLLLQRGDLEVVDPLGCSGRVKVLKKTTDIQPLSPRAGASLQGRVHVPCLQN